MSAQPAIELQDTRRLQVYQLVRGGWDRIAASDYAYCLFWVDDARTKTEEAALWKTSDDYVFERGTLLTVRDAFLAWEARLIEVDKEVFGTKVVEVVEPEPQKTFTQLRLVE